MNLNLTRGKALVVVAHPDDETIWMGGTILAHPEIDWTVLAFTRASDYDRAPRLRRAAKALGAHGIILNADDEERLGYRASAREMVALLEKHVPRNSFDYIFTHAANGEYGHLKHRAAHGAVKKLLKTNKLKTKNLFYFAYQMHKSENHAVPAKRSDTTIKLSKAGFNKKLNIVKNIYGFSTNSFELRSCFAIEKFNLMR